MSKKVLLFFFSIIALIVLIPAFAIIFSVQLPKWFVYAVIIVLSAWLIRDRVVELIEKKAKKRKSVIKTFAFCLRCKKVVLAPATKQPPELSSSLRYFRRRHSNHCIAYLSVILGPWRKGKVEDPMVPSYFIAQNGERIFFIERFKKKIAAPMRYKALKGAPPGFKLRWLLIRLLFLQ